jgi:ribosomal protein S18 acetylase RimI-like enzyme
MWYHQRLSACCIRIEVVMDQHQRVVVRRALPEDIGMIIAITDAAYAKYVPRLGRKPQPMTTDYHHILASHPVWLLCVDDQPAGVLVLMHEPDALLIYSVAIHPDYQKRGFGRQLLAWGEQEARRSGYARIRLFTNVLMEENIALYKRLGYRETGREPFQGLTRVHLAKQVERTIEGG